MGLFFEFDFKWSCIQFRPLFLFFCISAPEMILGKGHGFEADWWSLGALLWDMVCEVFFWKNEFECCKNDFFFLEIVDWLATIQRSQWESNSKKHLQSKIEISRIFASQHHIHVERSTKDCWIVLLIYVVQFCIL